MKKEREILTDGDSLDFEDIVISIEKSLNIHFEQNDFEKVRTYADFETVVFSKLNGSETNDCSSQQAFYKLRKLLVENFNVEFEKIKPQTSLEKIFPSKKRIEKIRLLQKLLNTKVHLLKPDFYLGFLAEISIIASIYFFFSSFFLGIALLIIGLLFREFSVKYGKDFKVNTVGELSDFMLNNDYQSARTNPETYNPREIKQIIKNIFSDTLGIDQSEINYKTVL